jgi:GNAT superfamily N-acetyltransferase
MLTLRPAIPADCPTIVGFIRELAEYEKLLHECQADPDALRGDLFPEPPQRPYAEVTLAELDGVPVGFALYFHNYSTFRCRPGIYLEDLYVQPHARNHGIGKALLKHLARLAVERNCARLEWSVLDWNAPSIAFYKSLGATPLDDWTMYRLTGDALAELAR